MTRDAMYALTGRLEQFARRARVIGVFAERDEVQDENHQIAVREELNLLADEIEETRFAVEDGEVLR